MRTTLTVVPMLMSALTLSGCTHDARTAPQVIIGVETPPDRCWVRAMVIPCDDIASHLQRTLKVPSYTRIEVNCVPSGTDCNDDRIFESLVSAGYDNVVGHHLVILR
jgi:hypothetical protein